MAGLSAQGLDPILRLTRRRALCDTPAVNTTIYWLTRTQLRSRVVILAVLAVATLGLGLVSWANVNRGQATVGTWQAAVAAAIPGVLLLVYGLDMFSRTVTDDTGLRVRRPLRRRGYAWSEIAGITAFQDAARGVSTTRVRIELVSGASFKLPMPLHSSSGASDLEFDQKVEAIVARWHAGAQG